MKPEFMKHLACPVCGGAFQLSDATVGPVAGEILSGVLSCRCRTWPIRGYIPRFCDQDYAENFGLQWNLFRRTQLDRAAQDNSESRFASEIGFRLEDVAGRLVLDAGCGMGRFADVVARWGGTVVGIDLSAAIEAAFDNIGARPNVHLVQADIGKLPFEPGTFDYVYSIGVLHHTPDPPGFFRRLVPLLKPGGRIAVCVYSREVGRIALLKRVGYRALLGRLPKPALLAVSRACGALGYRLAHVPLLRTLVGLLPAVVYPDKPKEWSELDTFDWLSPTYEFRYTRPEVRRWFEEAGLIDIRVTDGIPGWVCVTGTAPAATYRRAAGL
ncbi:methyltransferase domain-containing protein [Candidatus Nitrospira bockiana]